MNEELKELLNNLKSVYELNKLLTEKYKEDCMRFIINTKESELLLDYITNLQTIEQYYSQILSENAELRIDISAREIVCDDYKLRIDKAINFLKHIRDSFDKSDEMYELLDEAISLLQGSDDNDN